MKTIHPAIAEHAMEENERLRGLLRECRPAVQREVKKWTRASAILPVNANTESALLSRIDAALSPQSEPTDAFTAVDMATAAAQGFRDGQAAVEQAAAQDDREPVGWYTDDHLTDKSATTYDREVAYRRRSGRQKRTDAWWPHRRQNDRSLLARAVAEDRPGADNAVPDWMKY